MNSRSEFLKQRSSFLEDLMDLPWPIGAVLTALCYPIALLLSGYLASKPILESTSSVPLKLWPLFTLLFVFASLTSFNIGQKKKTLYKQNQSLEEIRGLTWRQFEFYIGQAYREKGYFVVETVEQQFESIVSPINKRRHMLVQENAELSKLRDWLLPVLMNGQVTVKQ